MNTSKARKSYAFWGKGMFAEVLLVVLSEKTVVRLRITGFVVALAMLLPGAALAAGPACGPELISAGDCCCGGEAPDAKPAESTAERTCCCDIQRAPATTAAHDAPATLERDNDAPEARVSAHIAAAQRPAVGHVRLPARARGPPPRTLFSQRVALIC